MMLGESQHRFHPTVQIPQWSDDPTATIYSPVNNVEPNSPYCIHEALTALQRYLPSNEPDPDFDPSLEPDAPVDAYSCDHFRMYEFKVRRCVRGRSHDWTECPYAHPGEKARRRDPRKYHYSGTACPDFRKGSCKKGDSCEFAHGVFECWLHPARYRTQPCKDGGNCKRRVCFFAHSADQLRVVNNSPDSLSSPLKAKTLSFSPPESPPESPMIQTRYRSRSLGSTSMNEMVASLRGLQLGKGKSVPSSWSVQMGGSPVFGSPRGGSGSGCRAGFCSLPSTPTQPNCYNRRGGFSGFDVFDSVCEEEEEPAMERVESGRDLRMKMLERLSKENALGRVERVDSDPDVGWVSDLLK